MKDKLLYFLVILTVSANTLLIVNEMGIQGALYLVTIAMCIYVLMLHRINLNHTTSIDEEWAKRIALFYFKSKRQQAIDLKREAQK